MTGQAHLSSARNLGSLFDSLWDQTTHCFLDHDGFNDRFHIRSSFLFLYMLFSSSIRWMLYWLIDLSRVWKRTFENSKYENEWNCLNLNWFIRSVCALKTNEWKWNNIKVTFDWFESCENVQIMKTIDWLASDLGVHWKWKLIDLSDPSSHYKYSWIEHS